MQLLGKLTSIKDNIMLCLNKESNDKLFLGSVVYILKTTSDSDSESVGKGTIFEVSKDELKLLLIEGQSSEIKINYNVYTYGAGIYISIGFNVLGNIIDSLGTNLLTKDYKEDFHKIFYNLNFNSLSVSGSASRIERKTVCKPLKTGITSVDTLIPIGLAQRQFVIGDKNVGKTSLSVTVIKNQRSINNHSKNDILLLNNHNKIKTFVPCVYVSIGQKRSEILRIRSVLINSDAN